MNDIRLNKEEEKEIVRAKFKIPPFAIVILLLLLTSSIVCFISGFAMMNYPSAAATFIVLAIFSFPIAIFYILWMLAISKCSCVVTNKRIYGVTNIFIAKKNYSYRLDEIDNVETISSLGVHGLSINFSQGHGPQGQVRYNRGVATVSGAGTFRISYVENITEVYDKLTELLTSVKNDKDLMVDIEMSKIEVESRKATAIENMANNFGSNTTMQGESPNYINELKGLKELLDAGIITKEEFDEKKRKLMN